MMGLEKMVASMLGVTPEQMQQYIAEFQELLTTLRDRLATIEQKQDEILVRINRDSNDDNGSER